jgi:hypothetical protein
MRRQKRWLESELKQYDALQEARPMRNSTCLDRKKHRRTTFRLVDGHEFEATVVSGRRHEAGIFGCRSWTLVPKPLLFVPCNILACSEVKSVDCQAVIRAYAVEIRESTTRFSCVAFFREGLSN